MGIFRPKDAELEEILASPPRIAILNTVYEKEKSFSEIQKKLEVKDETLSYYLDSLTTKGLLQKTDSGDYITTSKGHKLTKYVVEVLKESSKLPAHIDKSLSALAFITSNPVRIAMARSLYECGTLSETDLYSRMNENLKKKQENFQVGTESYKWHLSESIEEGIVKQSDKGYVLTKLGRGVVDDVKAALEMLHEKN